MGALPHCDALFLRFFDRWYDDDDRRRRGFKATLPDVLQYDSFGGPTPAEASWLNETGQQQVLQQINGMVEAARQDWPTYLPVENDMDLQWIDVFDRYYDRQRIHHVIKRSDPSDFSNDYVVLCCEFGAVLSDVLLRAQPHMFWRLDWPYWDSSLLDPKTGNAVSVFHWAIKKMSEYGVDDGFAAKTKAVLHLLDEERRNL